MNHHMLVSIVYGHADRPKNLQPRLEAWLLFRAPDVQGFAIDVLHDEIRKPLRSRAAIEQPRDILMLGSARICRSSRKRATISSASSPPRISLMATSWRYSGPTP